MEWILLEGQLILPTVDLLLIRGEKSVLVWKVLLSYIKELEIFRLFTVYWDINLF